MKRNHLKEIEKYVSEEFSKHDFDWFYKYHVKVVLELAEKLNKIKGGNEEIIKLAAVLHDFARIKSHKSHDLESVKIAKKILKTHDYSKSTIEQVSHCIETHRCRDKKPKTLEAKIISSADAMSHIKYYPILLWVAYYLNRMSLEEGISWVQEKIKRGWEQKILIPEAKKMVEKEYEVAYNVLNQIKKIEK